MRFLVRTGSPTTHLEGLTVTLYLTTFVLLALASAIPALAHEGTQEFANQTLSSRAAD